jgi:hypothetical protein
MRTCLLLAVLALVILAAPSAADAAAVRAEGFERTYTEFRNDGAFAAVKTDGSVVTWGPSASGGNSSVVAARLQSGVVRVYAT